MPMHGKCKIGREVTLLAALKQGKYVDGIGLELTLLAALEQGKYVDGIGLEVTLLAALEQGKYVDGRAKLMSPNCMATAWQMHGKCMAAA